MILCVLRSFFNNPYVINIISGLIVSGLVAWLLFTIFKKPDFDIELNYFSDKEKDVLGISLVNNKRFLSFEKNTVFAHFYLPEKILENAEVFMDTPNGLSKGELSNIQNPRDRGIVNGLVYKRIGVDIGYSIYPRSTTRVLYITGKFEGLGDIVLYSRLKTNTGPFPAKSYKDLDLSDSRFAIRKNITF